ncbi:MAG: tetratricopeptide repeat protein [Pseudomonadota bacterium]
MAMRFFLPLSVALLSVPGAAAEKRAAVVDPAFGETLYAFYQKQYFDAISRLLVARERGELKRQAAEGELLAGSLYVQYGMPAAAQDIFSTLLKQDDRSPQVQRIWLALAELNYRRDRFPEALAIIEQKFGKPAAGETGKAKDEPEYPEAAVMLAVKSLMRMQRYQEAVAWLGASVSDLPEGRYLRFNIAAALIGNGDTEGGAKLLEDLLAAPAEDEEMRALRDRVALALASTRLMQERPVDAFSAISAAQLQGPYSNEAMLVYGISAMRAGSPTGALRALLPLSKRSSHDQAVQEGLIALARAYELAGDDRHAHTAYRDALRTLQGELDWLQEQEKSLEDGRWFRALETRASDIALRDDRAGLSDADVLGMPLHYRMFAGNRFVLTFTQYVEVSRLARLSVDWQQRIPVMDYLVQSRVERHRRLAREAQTLLQETDIAPYEARQRDLAARIEAGIEANDSNLLATEKQKRMLAMADTAAAKMQAWPDRDWSEKRAQLQLLKGVLAWDMMRDQPVQAWELRHAVRSNDRLVADARDLRVRVEQAMQRPLVNVEAWRAELGAEDQRLRVLAQQSIGLRDALRAQLEADARETIRARREHIVQLAADGWFGIAQLEHGAWRAQRDARREAAGAPVQVGDEAGLAPAGKEVQPE